jgi:ribulose 1,5-bisphosphate carboxylase large subunit-like protein
MALIESLVVLSYSCFSESVVGCALLQIAAKTNVTRISNWKNFSKMFPIYSGGINLNISSQL